VLQLFASSIFRYIAVGDARKGEGGVAIYVVEV
jgi:hypothetical protein